MRDFEISVFSVSQLTLTIYHSFANFSVLKSYLEV